MRRYLRQPPDLADEAIRLSLSQRQVVRRFAERRQLIDQTAMLGEMRLGLSEPIRSLTLASLRGEPPGHP